MKEDLKSRIMRIIFEDPDEDEDVVASGKLEDVNAHSAKQKSQKAQEIKRKTPETGSENPRKANVLSSDEKINELKETSRSLFNIEAVPEKEKKRETKADTHIEETMVDPDMFEPSMNLSPIFGPIGKNDRKKKEQQIKTDTVQVNSPHTSYLDTVLSPIYGYDESKANEARSSIGSLVEKEEDDIDALLEENEYREERPSEENIGSEKEISIFDDFTKEDH